MKVAKCCAGIVGVLGKKNIQNSTTSINYKMKLLLEFQPWKNAVFGNCLYKFCKLFSNFIVFQSSGVQKMIFCSINV